MSATPFRLSIIEYLNAVPLNFGFRHGLGEGLFQFSVQVPSVCADQLRMGGVHGGLISSIEYLRIPDLRMVPGLCIASPKRVRSVLLVSKVPPEKIQRLALDVSSRTSVVLSQILLRERYGTFPEVTDLPPNLPLMLEGHDAALMIGDAAMRAPKDGLLVLDLAEEWHAWTGLPFVFAIWAVREDAPQLPGPGGAATYFHQSLEMGMAHIPTIVEEAWHRVGWTRQELHEYFTENIHYQLGEAEVRSLELFYGKAVEHGFAKRGKQLLYL